MRIAAILPACFLTLIATCAVRPLGGAESGPVAGPAPVAAPGEAPLVLPGPYETQESSPQNFEYDSNGKCESPGCAPFWQHRSGLFAEGLLLRPGNTDLIYAVERTGCDPAFSSPTGPVGLIAPDFAGGVRGGVTWALSDCNSLVATYTRFETDVEGQLEAASGRILASQVTHPSQASCGSNSIAAVASENINFQLVDLDYRQLLWGDCVAAINWTAGLRYAQLEQRFSASQNTGVATGLTDVNTDIDFDGFGFRLGLDGERRSSACGVLIYAKGFVNFIAGEFKADYSQVNQFGGSAVIGNRIEDYRVMSQLEAELGLGWQSDCGRYRMTAGYLTSGWFDALTTDSYVQSVRTGQQSDIGDSLSFNGLAVRLEVRH